MGVAPAQVVLAPVVPPRLVSSPEVPYPPDPPAATGDAVVVLELTVGADGSVRSAHAVSGGEPFAGAAVEAALTWRFEPATRDGKAVTSIIRFQLVFHPPAAPEPPREVPPEAPSAPAGSSSTPEKLTPSVAPPKQSRPAEVVVHGVYLVQAPAVSSFSKAEIRQLPGAFGDPFRAIEALPGVTPIVSGLPFFYVRGAPPGNVGYYFDGVRVPYLYHVGLGPSVIHPGMVDRVDLYPGGYPARYGRFAGGIVTGDATEPRDDFHGEGNIRLFDAGALVEGGFAGGRGTVLIGGRYSYTATILSLIVKDTKLDYHDYQGRITYDLTPHDRVSAFTFGSYDLLAQSAGGVQTVVFGSEFYRLDLRYDHSFATDSTVRFGVTLGYDQTRFLDQRNFQDQMVSTRVELRHPVKKGVVLRAGADFTRDGFTTDKSSYIDPEDPTLRILDSQFPSRTDLALGAWSDLVLDVAPRVQITPGVRFDVFSSG
ncbi:MAG TPA: TonB-dependent receptor plug domain-containing protein, partial [Polyangiaceae bacterium]